MNYYLFKYLLDWVKIYILFFQESIPIIYVSYILKKLIRQPLQIHVDANKTHREKAGRELLKNAMTYLGQILEEIPNEIIAVWPLTLPSQKP